MHATLTDATINGAAFKVVAALHTEEVEGSVLCGDTVQVGDVYVGGGFLNRAGVEIGRPARTLANAHAERINELEERARALRVAVAGTDDATKLAVYREKYATAVAALGGDQGALDALAPEAEARGETPETLAALVKSLGDAWSGAGLVIDAAYQGHKAAIRELQRIEDVDAYDISQGWPR